jgi:hypothetical protein
MKQYIKYNCEITDVQILDKFDGESSSNKIMSFYNFDNIINNDMFYNIYLNNSSTGIKISSIEQVLMLNYITNFKNITNILINYELIENEEIHFLFFIGKNIFIFDDNINDDNIYQKILLNPLVYGISNISEYFIKNNSKYKREILIQSDIVNDICHINIEKLHHYLYNKFSNFNIDNFILSKVSLVFGSFLIYHIYNLPQGISENSIIEIYKQLGNSIGIPISCLPVNDISVSKTFSRDIKYDPLAKDLHFYSSNSRQPWHNDYSHYPIEISPDWLMLFCLEPSEYGGITSLITNNKLKEILRKYEPELLEKIDKHNVNYLYIQKEPENIVHTKKLFDQKNNISNWNYFQIYKEYNDEYTMALREKYSIFLNKNITEGKISTLSKKWKKGDCIIFNDHFVMHERSSFYGARHLKDMHFMDKNIKLN